MEDVREITGLLGNVNDPRKMIEIISDWAESRAKDPSWGMLALDLFRRAKQDSTFGKRHAHLFEQQWKGLGDILVGMFPKGRAPADAETLGGIVFELTYGAAASFTRGPSVRDLVKTALTAMYDAYGKRAVAHRPAIVLAALAVHPFSGRRGGRSARRPWPILRRKFERIDVTLGVIEGMSGLRVYPLDGAEHLGAEQDVVDGNNLEQQIDTGLVIDAGIEEDVVHQMLGKRRLAKHHRQAAKASPMVGHGSSAVRDDEPQAQENP